MTTYIQISRKTASDVNAIISSMSIAIVVIAKSSVCVLKKCPVIDLVEDSISSIETLTFLATTSAGLTMELNYEGINARNTHRIIK